MRFISFSSGSCGNCYLLLGPTSGLMIDAGVGIRRVKKELEALKLGYDNISAILITHDHGDHIRSLGSFCKRLTPPVWTTAKLQDALAFHRDQIQRRLQCVVRITEEVALILEPCKDCAFLKLYGSYLAVSECVTDPYLAVEFGEFCVVRKYREESYSVEILV